VDQDLTYVFGGSALAIATVLAAYMAGLALGSALFGKSIDRRGHPLLIYGILEGGIGLWALLLPLFLDLLDRFYGAIYRSLDPGFYSLSFLRFALSFALLLVPTTLMGGTLPVLGKFLLKSRTDLGRRAGWLYAANTLGAVLGTALGGFLLLPSLGLRGATLLAVVLNLAVAVAAILAARRLPADRISPETVDRETPGSFPPIASPGIHTAVLFVYAASGFAALVYEVAWTKTLSMLLGNTTYAFTAMLTTFLLGLSLGSLLFGRLADRGRHPEALLGLVQAGIPLFALASIPILETLPQLFVDGFRVLQGKPWFHLELYRIALAGLTMILPTILLGGTFPLVTRIYLGREETGTRLGRLYAANTVGAILGSFLAGFVLVPWLGRQNTILAASFVNLAAALVLVRAVHWQGVPRRVRWALGAVLVLLVPGWILGLRPWDPSLMASGAYVYAPLIGKGTSVKESMRENSLLYYHEATEAAVSVWNTEFTLSLRTNGKIEASSHGDMVTQKLISHLPTLYHRQEPGSALMIGLASGISVGSLLTYPFERVETVELIPCMAEAAGYFDDYNHRCLQDPRHRLILNDGRNHLLLTGRTYDVIVSEPSNPDRRGGVALHPRVLRAHQEAAAPAGSCASGCRPIRCRKRICAPSSPHFRCLSLPDLCRAPRAISSSSPASTLRIDLDRLRAAAAGEPGRDLAALEILPLPQLLSLFVTDREGIGKFLGGWSKQVTDDNLYLEYAIPRHMFLTRG
jgi:spermidine synthase